jgi:5-methylcytosine-specific restriction endonuclease McrA
VTDPIPSSRAETLRERIAMRDGCRCVYCGEHFRCEELTLDHVEPRMRGGDQSEGNLVAACRACNTEKGSTPAWAFLAERPMQRENFLRHATSVWPRLRRAVVEAAEKAGGARRSG